MDRMEAAVSDLAEKLVGAARTLIGAESLSPEGEEGQLPHRLVSLSIGRMQPLVIGRSVPTRIEGSRGQEPRRLAIKSPASALTELTCHLATAGSRPWVQRTEG